MYVIREGLGRKWMPLAFLFAIAGLCGMLPVFQSNQTVQLLRESFAVPLGMVSGDGSMLFDFVVGVGRWGLRVNAYAFLLVTDRYPPFSLD